MTNRKFWYGAMLMLTAAWILAVPAASLWAQDEAAAESQPAEPAASEAASAEAAPSRPAAPEEPAPVEETKGFFGQVADFFVKGGTMMWPLLLCSVITVVFTLERLLAYSQAKINAVEFINNLRATLLKDGTKAAISLCDQQRGKPVANVVKSALLKFDEPIEEMEKTLENMAVTEVGRLEKFLPVLASMANIAPIIGFLGTVTGMINSFDKIAKFGLSNPNLVAAGISEALITTASGLMIALVAQPAYNYFTARVTRFLREMEAASNVLLETHVEMNRRSS